MAEHIRINYGFRAIPDKLVSDGDGFVECELRQTKPGTVLFDGLNNLTFIRCCLINVKINPKWKTEDCNKGEVDYSYLETEEAEMKEAAEKAQIVDGIVTKYAAEASKQIALADVKAAEIDPFALEASVIAAISGKSVEPIEGKP